jgi:acyl-CoA thioester hydrolase
MAPFIHIIHVEPADIDEMGHVNNVVYVRWVQDVAAAHWNAAANEMLRRKYRWVVLRHEIDYKSAVTANDTIEGATWVGQHQGAKFDRYVSLTSLASSKVVAQAKTTWCLLDGHTYRPIRIPAEILSLL